MSINSKPPEICREAFIQAREKLGLSVKELGGMACLSTRQIEQIENGETSSYYSAQIKVTAAKKVAKLLKLSEADAFGYGAQSPQKFNATQSALPIVDVEKMPVSAGNAVQDTGEVKEQAKEVLFTGAVDKPKSQSQKKVFLWLSVIAAGVFAVINLQPLFLADKTQEVIVVKEEIIAPVSPPVGSPAEPGPTAATIAVAPVAETPAPVIASGTSGVCPVEEGIISYKPEAARKPADMVFVQTKSQQVICVIDASGKTQNKLLEPGVGASFYGKPPFKVLTAGLSQVDIFFQGAKVRLANLNTKTLILEASEVSLPSSERLDSQIRQP